MVLEYYLNGTLEEAIDRLNGRELAEALAKQLAPILSTLCCSGITHIGIKPAMSSWMQRMKQC